KALLTGLCALALLPACGPAGVAAPPSTFSSSAMALMQAVANDDAARIRQLAAAGANVDARGSGKRGYTLLEFAMLGRHRSSFEALLAAGADPARGSRGSGTTAVNLAAQATNPHWLHTLLEHGASANSANTTTGETPLMSALL